MLRHKAGDSVQGTNNTYSINGSQYMVKGDGYSLYYRATECDELLVQKEIVKASQE